MATSPLLAWRIEVHHGLLVVIYVEGIPVTGRDGRTGQGGAEGRAMVSKAESLAMVPKAEGLTYARPGQRPGKMPTNRISPERAAQPRSRSSS